MDYWRLKALYPYLKDKSLSLEERQEVQQVLINKAEILLKGYKKHKNFQNKKEVEEIYNQDSFKPSGTGLNFFIFCPLTLCFLLLPIHIHGVLETVFYHIYNY